MTNHSEAAGSSGNSDFNKHAGRDAREGAEEHAGHEGEGGHGGCEGTGERGALSGHAGRDRPLEYAGHGADPGPCAEHQVTLRTPAELADALPYLLGYRPEDSIVLVALHDGERRGRFGGRARLGIPTTAGDWPSVAQQLSRGLVTGSERRGARPGSMVAYLCQEPRAGESGQDVMERLRPLAQLLRTSCGDLDVPVVEALCISDGRFWSYCCPGQGCCPRGGEAMGLPGTSVLAAAATYAGLQVRGTLRELTARLSPRETGGALEQEIALDTASMALVPRILDAESRQGVADEALGLARRILDRFADAPTVSGTRPADLRDDGLLDDDEAATLILGLQDRTTRDRAAEWMEGDEAGPALRLWRALARRCVGPYREHAAAPLTLAGWVAWSTGDELEAREALAMALGADSDYLFARLLHQACNEGLDPESIRRCLRAERTDRAAVTAEGSSDSGSSISERADCDATGPSADVASSVSGAAVGPADGTAPALRMAAAKSAASVARRRRRPRQAEGNGESRPSRPSSGTTGTRRRRPADEASPAGEGPGRTAGGASGRARTRARHGGGRQGMGEDM
ncbi:DUF4192 domain-containing protein [Streptomyces sp. R21]|uniref:DUF4192 domain-containing protein n=1 Tax=Streptomyces sp. R21 TaxID=3238627 RepID=A0AB39P561_9ACTN